MANTSIFSVVTEGVPGEVYVEGLSGADVLSFVAGDYFKIKPVKAADLRRLVVDRVEVSVTPKAAATKAPKPEPAAGGGEPNPTTNQEVHQ